MSPVAPSNNHVGRAALVALVGVILLFVGIGLATLALKGRNSPDLRLGDQTFQGGDTKNLAGEITRRGPIVYGDVSGRKDRDMILQHLGKNPEKGWYAFLAAPIDKPRDCTWTWKPSRQLFVATCDPTRTAPADGAGLTQFRVTVSKGRIDVNLNAEPKATTTTSPSTTSTSSTTTTGPN